MDEYISKQEAVDYCEALMNAELVQHTNDWGYGKERYNQTEVILNFIENRQPADVVPVVHGKWTKLSYDGFNCNECGSTFVIMQGRENMHFCPNCGAKMER